MTDTPKRIVGPIGVTGSGVTVYTVPASTVTIVRSIHLTNSNTSNTIGVTLGINGVAAANQFFSLLYVGSNAVVDWSGFLVLNAADTLQVLGSQTGSTITISGIEVS